MRIRDTHLSTRVINSLLRAGVRTTDQLASLAKANELSRIHGIGEKAIKEIETYLHERPRYITSRAGDHGLTRADIADADSKAKIPPVNLQSITKGLKRQIRTKIAQGRLHPAIEWRRRSLEEWLSQDLEANSVRNLIDVYSGFLATETIAEELSPIINSSGRSLALFVAYYSESGATYESLGVVAQVTRERVRQLIVRAEGELKDLILKSPAPSLRTSLKLAEDLGEHLVYSQWIHMLERSEILGMPEASRIEAVEMRQFMDAFISWIAKKLRSQIGKAVPQNLVKSTAIRDASVGDIAVVSRVDRALRRSILRKVAYSGGIHLEQVVEYHGLTLAQARLLLHSVDLREVRDGWYSYIHKDTDRRQPLKTAGTKMIEALGGPIRVSEFMGGLRAYTSRFEESLAPKDIVLHALRALGFNTGDENIGISTIRESSLSRSEHVFIDELNRFNSVVSSHEMSSAFEHEGLSYSAFSISLVRNSPLPVTVAQSPGSYTLYRLRGTHVLWDQIVSAAQRQNDPIALTRLKLGVVELHEALLSALAQLVVESSPIDTAPLDLDLEPPLPDQARIYMFNATHPPGGRTLGEHRIQLITPGQERGTRGSFDHSDGRVVLLVGYKPELEVFVLWDAGLYHNFAYSWNVQVKAESLYHAFAQGIAVQNREHPKGLNEDVVVARADRLAEGIRLRWRLTLNRLAQA